ncbi:Crp/Fnr family transcriptional regulator [Mucilaginibacter pallidiroseus]|uniref:Crp/Fnr family transcriptional regulator n=1 Tax=Mucilaginibacter pallidiroseus TaxID=2599295 RepID=A0A563U0L5_9SPHI|nr:Crp/Fnr family transcriptional regulator [Mucilaginibacter pallidiroseus]TWR25156.1 Crp/Fnr family transcriptional regulator [Mucilaginibacter pallidiroseus]
MRDKFEEYIISQTGMPAASVEHISSLACAKTLKRNELLVRAGEVCRNKIFVVSGLLRNYGVAANGSEHVLQFAPELSWTLDVESYDNGTPAISNIGAVEPSEVLLWAKADFDSMLQEYPLLKHFSQQVISRNIYYNRRRVMTALSASPEEKYEEFVRSFPKLLGRLPLHMIASYLGISLKTLTRLRHAQLLR